MDTIATLAIVEAATTALQSPKNSNLNSGCNSIASVLTNRRHDVAANIIANKSSLNFVQSKTNNNNNNVCNDKSELKRNGEIDGNENSNGDGKGDKNGILKNATVDGNTQPEVLFDYFGIRFKQPLKKLNVFAISLLHILAVMSLFMTDFNVRCYSIMWGFLMGGIAGFGVTAGAHRLWSHRAYKAKLPMRVILMLCYSVAGQNTLYDWVRDHRVHHKFSETDADPHNSNRGFFFAHVGWLMMRKHPDVLKKGKAIDMSDILGDPVIQFHQSNFVLLKLLLCFMLPICIPVYCWNESWKMAILSQALLRYTLSLNFTWLVNSAAHMWGQRPYDNRINPVENRTVSFLAMGEGWHNYHHVFPWDYKAAELGNYSFNVTTFWIDMAAKIGWAYDLKQPSKELIRRSAEKYGDGNHPVHKPNDQHRQYHNHHYTEEVPPPDDTTLNSY